MHIKTKVRAITPIQFNAEVADLYLTAPYQKDGVSVVDIEVVLSAPIENGRIEHSRKHTYPATVLQAIGIDRATLSPSADWPKVAALFAEKGLEVIP